MLREKNSCGQCRAKPVPSTQICADCLRREAMDNMMLAWSLLRPVERETFMRRAGVGRFAA